MAQRSAYQLNAVYIRLVVVVVVVFIILLGESQQTGLLLGTLGGFLYYGQKEMAMLLDDSRMEAHSTDLLSALICLSYERLHALPQQCRILNYLHVSRRTLYKTLVLFYLYR